MNMIARLTSNFSPAPVSAPVMADRTMLASLNIKQWGARRTDRKATRDVISAAGAASNAGRFNKWLIDPKALAGVQAAVSAARQEHAEYTLPWCNDGTRILPADAFLIYSEKMQRHRESFESEVALFLDGYQSLANDAQRHLGSLFDRRDYPGVAELRRRFAWSVDILPMPDASDFRVELGDSHVAAIKARIEQSTQDALSVAMGDTWTRLHGVVSKMVERLGSYKPAASGEKAQGIFRDSLVDNIRELVEVLPLLNIAGDANLSAMIDRARAELCEHSAGELRDDSAARNEVAEAAESIMADMAGFMGG